MQPSEFDSMDYDEAFDLARRVFEKYSEEVELEQKLQSEHTKVLVKAAGARFG